MAYINKKDTDGNKSLLQEGELGYDKNLAGGDVGRVYVGKGDENVPLAKKSEVDAAQSTADTHIGRTDNPHATTKAQVGLGNVDNTSDLAKPISTAQQAALDLKADQATTYTKTETETKIDEKLETKVDKITGSSLVQDTKITSYDNHIVSTTNPHSVTKTQVGLGNVDNTSDLDKPISANTQDALNLKAPLLSPAFTGTPTAPTPTAGDNSTKVATTAFVQANASSASVPNATTTVKGIVELATSIEARSGTDSTRAVTPSGLHYAFNKTGTAPMYACRAWVNFNGTGTVAIRESGNVSSITDNGTGSYTVNFANAMPDANYCASLGSLRDGTNSGHNTIKTISSSSIGILTGALTADGYDHNNICVSIFR